MRAAKTYRQSHAIVVTSEHLKYFEAFFRKHYEEVEYSVYCSDGTEIEFPSMEDLLAYENPSFKRITRITIKGELKPYNRDISLSLELGNVEFLTRVTAYYSVQYNDLASGINIERELQDRIRELRPWFWWITTFSFMSVVWKIYSLIIVVFLLFRVDALLNNRYVNPPRAVDRDYVFTWILGVVVAVVGVIVLTVIDKFKDYFFPKLVFCVGKQTVEFQTRQKRWSFVFGVIIIGLILNIISGYIFAQLFSP